MVMRERGISRMLRIRVGCERICQLSGCIVCLATLCGLMGRLSWMLDLFSHFRVQYLVSLIALAGTLAILRSYRAAFLFLGFAVLNGCFVLPQCLTGMPALGDTPLTVRALLINVNTSQGDPARVITLLQHVDADLVVLEEVDSRWLSELQPATVRYAHSLIEPRPDNFGIALYSKFPLLMSSVEYLGESSVPTLVAQVKTNSGTIHLIGTHPLPPVGARRSHLRNNQLQHLARYVRSIQAPTLVLGDLNATPWCPHFVDLLAHGGLQDSSRGRGLQPSWPVQLPLLLIPLDHCLHTRGIKIVRRKIGPNVRSDHYPLIVEFALTP